MNKKIFIAALAVALIGGAFYGGVKYAEAKKTADQNSKQGNSNFGKRGLSDVGRIANGEIISKDSGSITVGLKAGGSKIIFLSGKTSISKSVDGTIDDLTVGKQVSVMGSANSDGSVNAESVQIRSSIPPISAPSNN